MQPAQSGSGSGRGTGDQEGSTSLRAEVPIPHGPAPPRGGLTPEVIAWMTHLMEEAVARAQRGAVPEQIPPIPPPRPVIGAAQEGVPAAVPSAAGAAQSASELLKLIASARQLGCETFSGTADPEGARRWLRTLSRAVRDLAVEDADRVRLAGRLMDGDALDWYEGLLDRQTTPVDWDTFLMEFHTQFYTDFFVNSKKAEFYKFRQGPKTVTEYESEFRALLKYVPEISASEAAVCTKFEDGLRMEVRRYMGKVMPRTYKNMLETALLAEQLVPEKSASKEEHKGKRRAESSEERWREKKRGQSAGRSSGVVHVSAPSEPFVPQSQPQQQSRQQTGQGRGAPSVISQTGLTTAPQCFRCGRAHFGLCARFPGCFYCGQPGHIRRDCPVLVFQQGTLPATEDPQRTQSSRGGGRGRPAEASPPAAAVAGSSSAVPQGGRGQSRQARMYTLPDAEMEADPDAITGTIELLQHSAKI